MNANRVYTNRTLFSTCELSKFLGVSRKTIYRAVAKRKLLPIKGLGRMRFTAVAVAKFIGEDVQFVINGVINEQPI